MTVAETDAVSEPILAVDKLNPQNAARLVPPLGRWRGSFAQAWAKSSLDGAPVANPFIRSPSAD